MLLHRFGERAEDDAHLGQLGLEGRGHGDAVKNGVHRDACQDLAFLERDAELLVGGEQRRIHLVEALGLRFELRGRVVDDRLVVDRGVVDVGPLWLLHGQPVPVGLQPPFEHELGLVLLGRDQSDHVFVQAPGHGVRLDVGDESVLVLLSRDLVKLISRAAHKPPPRNCAPAPVSAPVRGIAQVHQLVPQRLRHLCQRDLFQGPVDRLVDHEPVRPDRTLGLDVAVAAYLVRALGDRDGPFESTDDLRNRDLLRVARKPVPALGASLRNQQSSPHQLLQNLADHRQRQTDLARDITRIVGGTAAAGDVRQHHNSVIRQFRHSKHVA